MTRKDRFGNQIQGELPYARGRILRSTNDDYVKITKARRIINRRIKEHGRRSIFNFSGLERTFPSKTEDLGGLDDETVPAIYAEEFHKLALEHLGGSSQLHDIFLANRMTAATVATHLAIVKPDQTVIGVSSSFSHPGVIRAANHVGARFVDTVGAAGLKKALARETRVSLVCITRLAVTYDILDARELNEIVRICKENGAITYLDDAGGARVGPAIFGQPKSLELGVDIAATGLDKYGTYGPRFGLLGGKKHLVANIRSKAWEFGLEARPVFTLAALQSLRSYDPTRVKLLVQTTKIVGEELRKRLGGYIRETPVTSQILADDLLELAIKRSGRNEASIVPYEAAAVLAMLLLRDYGIITVHFAGVPPGTGTFLFKFISPETLERFGGPNKFAEAVDSSIDKLAELLKREDDIRKLLFEDEEIIHTVSNEL